MLTKNDLTVISAYLRVCSELAHKEQIPELITLYNKIIAIIGGEEAHPMMPTNQYFQLVLGVLEESQKTIGLTQSNFDDDLELAIAQTRLWTKETE